MRLHIPRIPAKTAETATVRTSSLNDPIVHLIHQDYTTLHPDQTVGEALEWLRSNPPAGRIIYFYVVDADGVLCGVVPTRRLILGDPEAYVADIMVRELTTLPSTATVQEACEFFTLYRLLAFPVVDNAGRLVGIVDIELYTGEIERMKQAAPAARFLRPFAQFMQIESSGGIILLVCTLAALILANSPWSTPFNELWETRVGFDFGSITLKESLRYWINEGMMTMFFFVVGLEIKREFVTGELSDRRKAILPLVAAAGGMIVPGALYLIMHWGAPTAHGWGIPTATDIAFVVGFLVLFGRRVPHGLKVFLLSLAIMDDIGAILVIALGYSRDIALAPLTAGLALMCLGVLFRWAGVQGVIGYATLGALIWLGFLKSGVNPTVVGVMLGLLTPIRPLLGQSVPIDRVAELLKRVAGTEGRQLEAHRDPVSPADRLEHALHPWVAFFIMPIFALANAGVSLETTAFGQPVAIAVAIALILGKPLGIMLFSLAFLGVGWGKLPDGVTRKVLFGGSCLAGIGFTMSLFIAGLAFDGPHLQEAKVGILVGSALSGGIGSFMLWWFLPRRARSMQATDRNASKNSIL
ncbi:MAG TPA: Na+/H+ antiporter NhaA [Geobacteraceae bacterium]